MTWISSPSCIRPDHDCDLSFSLGHPSSPMFSLFFFPVFFHVSFVRSFFVMVISRTRPVFFWFGRDTKTQGRRNWTWFCRSHMYSIPPALLSSSIPLRHPLLSSYLSVLPVFLQAFPFPGFLLFFLSLSCSPLDIATLRHSVSFAVCSDSSMP